MNESPLEALRAGQLGRAYQVADSHSGWKRALFHLLLAWEQKDDGKLSEARRTLERLTAGPLPSLRGWYGDYGALLLAQVADVGEDLFARLRQELLGRDRLSRCAGQPRLSRQLRSQELLRARAGRYQSLCRRLVERGLDSVALAVCDEIADLELRISALCEVGKAQARTRKANEAEKTLESATELARGVRESEPLSTVAAAWATSGNIDRARAAALEIPVRWMRYDELATIAWMQMEAGDRSGALRTLVHIDLRWAPDHAFIVHAWAQAWSGKLASAFRAARLPKHAGGRVSALLRVAAERAIRGDRDSALGAFRTAVSQVHGARRCSALGEIATAMVAAGELPMALEAIGQIRAPQARAKALLGVASAETRAGKLDEARATLTRAVEETSRADGDWERGEILKAAAASRAGQEAGEIILCAAEVIADHEVRAIVLRAIALAEDRRGERMRARELLQAATEHGVEIHGEAARASSLADISESQVGLGDGAAARTTIAAALLASRRREAGSVGT